MSDLDRYIEKRKTLDKDFADNFEGGFVDFKISVVSCEGVRLTMLKINQNEFRSFPKKAYRH